MSSFINSIFNKFSNNNNNNNKQLNITYSQEDRGKLFYKIFHNVYLRRLIFNHIRLYNQNKNRILNKKELAQYQYKIYCRILVIEKSSDLINIPNYITTLSINGYIELNSTIMKSLPKTITTLKVCNNIIVQAGIIPSNIKNLIFLPGFSKVLVTGFIPVGTLENLYFNSDYPQTITTSGIIPEGVKVLVMSKRDHLQYSQPTNTNFNIFPSSLQELDYGCFNYAGDPSVNLQFIPHGVKKFSISCNFLHFSSVEMKYIKYNITSDFFPNSITYLRIAALNIKLEKNDIPSSVKTFILEKYKHPIDPNVLPSSITYLDLGINSTMDVIFNNYLLKDSIPQSTKTLLLSSSFSMRLRGNAIPRSVEYLKFGYSFDVPIEIGDLYNYKTEDPYGNLRTLIFGEKFNKEIAIDTLPHSIIDLEFGLSWNKHIIMGSLPFLCKRLKFGSRYNQPIESDSQLPPNLEEIQFGYDFNCPLIPYKSLPNSGSLKYLNLGRSYNHPIEIGTFPDSLTIIKFGCSFQQPLSLSQLPKSIKSLQLSSTYNLNLISDIPDYIIDQEIQN